MGKSEFEKFAMGHAGISSLALHRFNSAVRDSISPTIIEERQMNVAAMDVFSRLMMDRIIFLGCPINDDVATICTGLAASMGAVLLTAGTKGKRSALPHARVMIHQPLGGVEGQASDIEITARQILRTKQELYEILSTHSGVTMKKIEKDADRDYWMTAPEAKKYGLIDEVLTPRKKK